MDIDELRKKYGMPPTIQQKSPRKTKDVVEKTKEPSPVVTSGTFYYHP